VRMFSLLGLRLRSEAFESSVASEPTINTQSNQHSVKLASRT
jgi:hypothetical protein